MEGYLTYYYEYHFLYITGIDRVESKSIQGAALMKLIFHEGTDMASAMAETVGYVNRARAFMPPGTVPPFITRFDAGSVAVGQLVFSSADAHAGRVAGFRAQPRAAFVRDTARRFRSATLRWESENHRRHARSRQAPAIQDLAGGGDRGGQQGHAGDALRQYVDRRDQPHRPDERGARRKSFGTAEHADPAGLRHYRLPARYRNHRERHRHHHRLRARQRQENCLHPRDQARGCLDACRHQRCESGDTGFQESRAGRCGREPAIRSVAVRHQLSSRV